MNVTLANIGTETIFIPGPNIEIAPGTSKDWNEITIDDLDTNTVIKEALVAGTLTATCTPESLDAAKITQSGRLGIIDPIALPRYTVATLPATNNFEGQLAFATNGRKTAEGPGAGTGVPVYWSAAAWHVYYDDSVVAA